MNYFILAFLLLSIEVFAECDVAPLRKQVIHAYSSVLPVKNEKGELGSGRGKDFFVSNYLMKVKNENFLIANFEFEIKWLSGERQTVKTLVVASVDPATCTIESYESGDTLGSSMTKN